MSTSEKVDSEGSRSTKDRLDETNEHTLCYICGGNGANWSMSTKANENEKTPYFPCLQSMEQAEGAKPVKENGGIDTCTVCFSFLLQQWHSYEENDTPMEKRTYWLKRTGVGGIEFNYREHDFDVEHSPSELKYLEKDQETIENYNNVELEDKNEQNCLESCGYDKEQNMVEEQPCSQHQELGAAESMRAIRNDKSDHLKSEDKLCPSETAMQSCFICGCEKVKDAMRIVHTKPQLKTETPFYPFLLQHNSPFEVKKTEFSGKVTVCQSCDMSLFKQWHNFQRKGTRLSERHYHLPSSSASEQKQHAVPVSTVICFICGEKHHQTSCWDVYSRKKKPGEPYFPFLTSLSPAAGKVSLQEGSVQTCTPCYKSLLCQWDDFQSKGVSESERNYSVENRFQRTSNSPTLSENKPCSSLDDTCSVCKVSYPVYKLEYIKQSFNRNHLTPLANEQKSERIPVCCHCKKVLAKSDNKSENANEIENQCGIPPQCNKRPILNHLNSKVGVPGNKNEDTPNIYKENENFEVCFLCGEKVKRNSSKCLYVLPRHDANGYRPFFPSLAYMVAAYHAKPLAPSGSVVVCCYCHGNMTNQWYEFEKQAKNHISNPWSRQYAVKQFACYLCRNICSRQKIASISAGDYPFLNKLKKSSRAFRVNEDYVVCHHCKEIATVQKENFDKCGVGIYEREFELPMVSTDSKIQCLSKPLKRRRSGSQLSSDHPVVVIGDSESEGDDREQPSKLEQQGNTSHDHNLSKLLTGLEKKPAQVEAKDVQCLPMSSHGAKNSSFAAALRKLAKQAMSPGSHSPVTIPSSSNPNLSPAKNKGCESPKLNGGSNSFKKEVPDTSYLSSKENRGHLNQPSTSDHIALTTNMGHQIVPGVFSLGPRVGYENKSNPLEELHGQSHMQDVHRIRALHPQPPFYMPFLQRPVMSDSVYMTPFHYYPPPPMVEPSGLLPPGFDHEAWRKRRAVEHIRQQHERHTHFFSPHDRPLYIMEQEKPLSSQTGLPTRPFPGDLAQAREKNLGKSSPRHDSGAIPDPRTTNCSTAKENEKNVEVVCSSRSEHTPALSCPRQSLHSPGAPAIVTSVLSPAPQTQRSSPKDSAPGEREGGDVEEGKDMKQREHQIMWTRKMFEQKRRLRQEEIEWQHRQQQMRQQKREVQQELYQFRQKLLQQKESEMEDLSKEHGKLPEKDEGEKNWSASNERAKEKTVESMDVNKITFPQFGYPVYPDQPVAPQTMHIANMYRTPGLQQHEMFYPPGYPTQAPLAPRMDARMYREYLQQPSHLVENKVVTEWLEKQRQTEFIAERCPSEGHRNNVERSGLTSLVFNGKHCNDVEKYSHEPQKLKFMKDLGLMTVSEKKERVQTVFGNGNGKRKFDNVNNLEDELESNKENRVENGERITDAAKLSTKGTEQENESETYSKKVDFLYNLGLVTHRKRQELEDDFEKNRWERKTLRIQKKTKRTKKEKKEEKERNRSKTPLDLGVSGPITRQKQQLLQEYGLLLPIKDSCDKDSSSSPDSTMTSDPKEQGNQGQAKKSKKEDDEFSIKNDGEKTCNNTYSVSAPPRPSTTSKTISTGPQLTLQSITHMENPYTGFSSAFHPPFYHSGLLSVHPDTSAKDNQTLFQNKPFLPTKHSKETNLVGESLNRGHNFTPVVPTSMGMYDGQYPVMHPSCLPTDGTYKWPGIKKITQSYSLFHQEQESKLNFSKEKSEILKGKYSKLNKESAGLNSTYKGLIHGKQKLEEEHHSLTGKLEKLHNFVVLVQNS